MNTKQADESALVSVPRGAALAEAPTGRWLTIGVIASIVVAGLLLAVWQQVREHVLAGGAYVVDPQQISITPPPAWIHSEIHDIRAEVLREASLNGPLSLLAPDLTVQIAEAFADHPWVAHVTRVSKQFPATVEVVLEYRRPVAMVEVQGGVYPVDVEGVLLPPADFSASDAKKYPRISKIFSAPPKQTGSRWADPAVIDGAQIAAVLADDWQELGLWRIELAGRQPTRTGAVYTYNLLTVGDTRIVWGCARGGNLPGELPAGDKMAQLKAWIARHGSLDQPEPSQQLQFQDDGVLARLERRLPSALPANGE